MPNLSQEQEEMRQSIQKAAMITSIIMALLTAGLAFWLLAGQSGWIRIGGASLAGLVVLLAVFKWRFIANSKSAQCEKCSAAFSITKSDHIETLKSSTAKDTREKQEDGSVEVTTWLEEVFDVVDTYTCAKCSDVKTKEYTTTRKKDEKTTVEPAALKKAAKKSTNAKTGAKQKTAAGTKGAKKTGGASKSKSAPKTGAKKPKSQ